MLKNFLKVAIRNTVRRKAYSVINISGLAVGITCALLIMINVADELSYDRYHDNSDRIYRVVTSSAEGAYDEIAKVSGLWGPNIQRELPGVEAMTRFRFVNTQLVSYDDKQFYENNGFYADPSVFDIFSFKILQGEPDEVLSDPNAIVVTESFAQRYYGQGDAIGKVLQLDDRNVTVTGVMAAVPDNSHFTFDFLVPVEAEGDSLRFDPLRSQYYTYLLLDENSTAASIEEKLSGVLVRNLGSEIGSNYQPRLQALTDIHLRSNLFREMQANGSLKYIVILSIVALLILVIACVNFMNLATARSMHRAREVGVRKASGAGRTSLITQFLGESLVLTVISIVLAIGAVTILLPFFNEISGKNLGLEVLTRGDMIAGLIGLTLVVTLAAGSYPAFILSGFKPSEVLKGEVALRNRSAFRKGLVVFQFAISIFLIASVGVVNEQLKFIQNRDLGFDEERLMVIPIRNDDMRYATKTVGNELKKLPSVVNVTASGNLPGGGDYGFPLYPENIAEERRPAPRILVTDDEFIATYNMEIVEGRDFNESAGDAGGAFMVNETLASQLRLAGWESPVGKNMGLPPSISETPLPVVGVVRDFHFRSLHESIGPLVFYKPPPDWYSFFTLRLSTDDLFQAEQRIEEVWNRFDAEHPMSAYFLDQSFDALYQAETRVRALLGYATGLAVIVACLGLFGLAAFTAEQRTKEIGIRKVLGASVSGIVVLLSREYARLIGISLVIAAPLAYLATENWLENFAYRIQTGIGVLIISGIIALVVAIVTVSFQSVRAAYADPVKSLRYE